MAIPEETGDGTSNGDARGRSYRLSNFSPRFLQIPRQPRPEVTVEEGYYLFNSYLAEDFDREHIEYVPDVPIEIPTSHTIIHVASPSVDPSGPMDYSSGDTRTRSPLTTEDNLNLPSTSQDLCANRTSPVQYTKLGREIRELADDFKKSKQGKQVMEKADQVDLDSLSLESLQAFLSGVFHDGQFSRTTIVAVFVFCSALVIKAINNYVVHKAYDKVSAIVRICFDYIREKLCKEVQEHGGWDRVVGGVLSSVAKSVASTIIIATAAIVLFYMWKK